MEKRKVMTEGAISLGALTLLPVSESICLGERIGRTVLFRAFKRPIAIVVISPAETRVFRITGKEISLAALMTEVPEPSAPADKALFFAETRVEAWDEVAIPNDMTRAEFELFVVQAAVGRRLGIDRAFPFAVRGSFRRVLWHVVTGEPAEHSHQSTEAGRIHSQGHAKVRVFDQADVTGFLFGFYSGVALEGVISHPGERFHVHYADEGFSVSGHVDDYRIVRGAVLLLPRR
jgi:hypothetical protein